jgi:hypothetical protein
MFTLEVMTTGVGEGGERRDTSHTTQAPSRMKKRNEWTHGNEKILVLVNFIILLYFI